MFILLVHILLAPSMPAFARPGSRAAQSIGGLHPAAEESIFGGFQRKAILLIFM